MKKLLVLLSLFLLLSCSKETVEIQKTFEYTEGGQAEGIADVIIVTGRDTSLIMPVAVKGREHWVIFSSGGANKICGKDDDTIQGSQCQVNFKFGLMHLLCYQDGDWAFARGW